ncbi:hypothetical protein DQ04_04501070, partial [Trypanosoma grayi]|uniref:hypothetical protein n=1 Tax=Trypanosoma grayi TaxID=71804 RepID=UPI0004F4B23C
HHKSRTGAGVKGKKDRQRPTSKSAAGFVACAPDTPLSECLQRILRQRARRIVVLAEKEARDLSVVAILNLQQVLAYLGAVFLSIEAAGSGRRVVGAAGDVAAGVTAGAAA